MQYVRWFEDVGLGDVASVGSKVASLGELIRELGPLGVRVPGGFAVTADGYRHFLEAANLGPAIGAALAGLVRADVDDLVARAARIRALIEAAPLPAGIEVQVRHAYRELSRRCAQEGADVAVRSSAAAEDSTEASFAGQHHSFLNVRGEEALLDAVRRCFTSSPPRRTRKASSSRSRPSGACARSSASRTSS